MRIEGQTKDQQDGVDVRRWRREKGNVKTRYRGVHKQFTDLDVVVLLAWNIFLATVILKPVDMPRVTDTTDSLWLPRI